MTARTPRPAARLKNLLLTRETLDERQRVIVSRFFRQEIYKLKLRDFVAELACTVSPLDNIPRIEGSSCAVVGNGNSVLRKRWGEDIDQHDIVIRINEFREEEYFPFMGSKTTIHLFNEPRARQLLDGEISSYGRLTIFTGPTNENHAIELFLDFASRHQPQGLYLLLPSFREAIDRIHPDNPSAGFISVCIARHLGLETSLFGFNIDGNPDRVFSERKFSLTRHHPEFEYGCYRKWSGERFQVFH